MGVRSAETTQSFVQPHTQRPFLRRGGTGTSKGGDSVDAESNVFVAAVVLGHNKTKATKQPDPS